MQVKTFLKDFDSLLCRWLLSAQEANHRSVSLDGFSYVLTVWTNGFKKKVWNFPLKFKCIHFTDQRIFIFLSLFKTEPYIKLDEISIKMVDLDEAKFLGIAFDRRLTFRAHVKYLKSVCDKALNVLRVVDHADWKCRQSSPLVSLSCTSTF